MESTIHGIKLDLHLLYTHKSSLRKASLPFLFQIIYKTEIPHKIFGLYGLYHNKKILAPGAGGLGSSKASPMHL